MDSSPREVGGWRGGAGEVTFDAGALRGVQRGCGHTGGGSPMVANGLADEAE